MNKIIILTMLLFLSSLAGAQQVECRDSKLVSTLERILKNRNYQTLERRLYNKSNAIWVKGLRVNQILKMTKQTLKKEAGDVYEAVKLFDNDKIMRWDFTSDIKLPADYYSVIYGYVGDTEVGVIFAGDTDEMVAEMSDEDIKLCSFKRDSMP